MTSVKVYHSQLWFSGITSNSVVEAAVVVDTSNVLYPTGGILFCFTKVKVKVGLRVLLYSDSYMSQAQFLTSSNKTANIYVKT